MGNRYPSVLMIIRSENRMYTSKSIKGLVRKIMLDSRQELNNVVFEVHNFSTDEKMFDLKFCPELNMWAKYYPPECRTFEHRSCVENVVVPESEMVVIIPESFSEDGVAIPEHEVCVNVPEHEAMVTIPAGTSRIELEGRWVPIPSTKNMLELRAKVLEVIE